MNIKANLIVLILGFVLMTPSLSREEDMTAFSAKLAAKMPEGMNLPNELVITFDWMEANGHLGLVTGRSGDKLEDYILSLYPFDQLDDPGTSHAYFHWDELAFTYGWENPDPEIDKRVFVLATTGGDGSRAGIWLDEDGKQRFVHIGSGSGSVWAGVISDDPLTFLRFMSIGYNEPAFDEHHDKPILEALYAYHGVENAQEYAELRAESDDPDDDYPMPKPPLALQKYLKEEFGVETPPKASEIVRFPAPEYGETKSGDPFILWLEKVQPPLSEKKRMEIEEWRIAAEELAEDMEDGEPSLWRRFVRQLRFLKRALWP